MTIELKAISRKADAGEVVEVAAVLLNGKRIGAIRKLMPVVEKGRAAPYFDPMNIRGKTVYRDGMLVRRSTLRKALNEVKRFAAA